MRFTRIKTISAMGALIALLAACGAEQSQSAGGLTQEQVCERFLVLAGQGMSVEVRNGREISPAQAIQHRDFAQEAAEFGRWAQAAEDEDLAGNAARITDEADVVLESLPADASDRRADELTEALYAQTTQLYAVCVAEAYRRVMAGEIELTGACAEPDASTLEGPNVVVYPPGQDFEDSTCELVQGQPRDQGCAFDQRGSIEAEAAGAVATVEVAYDPDTCRALYESGRVRSGDPG